ncbi:DUF1906 domain-containing protein [Streptomyces sp. SID5770]|uniref:DUF1906 domain-containing protein n=1 Tax=Streptomyces sp. SID5770 TaxID=2690308 RepID=UPI0023519A81|nr:DUF1906 domain-containing protein [Streptomyces sp. SID5770]
MSTSTPPRPRTTTTSAPARSRTASPFTGVRAVAAALMAAVAGTALLDVPAPTAVPPPPPATTRAAAAAEAVRTAAPGAPAAPRAPASAVSTASAASTPVHFTGKAFDTCEAPSVETMRAWRGSPYGAVGIYFAGRGRGCPGQRELGHGWVASVQAMGWRLLPVFVGSQAPCVEAPAKKPFAIGSDPWGQGTREAGDAVRAARALGLDTSSPLYLDIESYRRGDAPCAATTLSFVRAWNREVRRLGYLPGFYSSADTGVRDIEAQRKAGTADLPAVMWFARWLGKPALATEAALAPAAWTPHARIHQYAGNVAESYGGHRLVIDRNAVDAPVARLTTARTGFASASRTASHASVPSLSPVVARDPARP